MGDLECEFQKKCMVETPWKFEAKFLDFFISGRSSADLSKTLSCFLDIPSGVLKHELEKSLFWNFVRVRFAGWELLTLLKANMPSSVSSR